MHIVLVINPSGGTFRRLPVQPTVQAIASIFAAAGHQVDVNLCQGADLADHLGALAQRDDIDAVVVGGGDGTILTAIVAGLGRGLPLGILPLGTLNLLARDLDLPLDPLKAAELLAHGHTAAIDLGEVNGRPFAVWASLGLHPLVVRRRDRLQKEGLSKWPAFALALLRVFRRYPLITVTLSLKGESRTIRTPLLIISNNVWNSQPLPPRRQSLDDGELQVHVVKVKGRLGLFGLALAALLGLWQRGRLLETTTADEVRVISRKRRVLVSLDGEVMVEHSPLVFRLRPRALLVLAPRPVDKTQS